VWHNKDPSLLGEYEREPDREDERGVRIDLNDVVYITANAAKLLFARYTAEIASRANLWEKTARMIVIGQSESGVKSHKWLC
jgi:hypothetical protein